MVSTSSSFFFVLLLTLVSGECPWSFNLTALHSACSCSLTAGHQLTVQCSLVSMDEVVSALGSVGEVDIALLFVSNGSVSALQGGALRALHVSSLQLTQCGISEIARDSFSGQETKLESLGLQDNGLESVPSEALRSLRALTHLDLSRNKIKFIDHAAFVGPPLQVLKLNDNPLVFHNNSLLGLESSLRNLGLRATGQDRVPPALGILRSLAFLDFAQNRVNQLDGNVFKGLKSLTALNLERNPLARIPPDAFQGVEGTISSLSLLSAALEEFPVEALKGLTELRVLDLGFNKLSVIPDDAFESMSSLTLLALDGNPLKTLNVTAFQHLNSTLRGLSIGGRFLSCDCRLRWLSKWIHDFDLQVTSRERNPQFCGNPPDLRGSNFAQLSAEDLNCELQTTTRTPTITTPTQTTVVSTISSTKEPDTTVVARSSTDAKPSNRTWAPRSAGLPKHRVRLVNASRTDSTIWITWEVFSAPNNHLVPEIRVAFRLFGENQFKMSKSLSPQSRQFRINKVPPNECLMVCVLIGHDDPATHPVNNDQCSEVRSERIHTAETDKVVIIAASAAICVAVIIAVIIFVCCNRRQTPRYDRHPRVATIGPLDMTSASVKVPNWDTGSVYSTRSIPRAQMYHLEKSDNAVLGSLGPKYLRSQSAMGQYLNPLHSNPSASLLQQQKKRPYAGSFRSLGALESNPWSDEPEQAFNPYRTTARAFK
uniref:LRRCT domain-containing protein n=1 Tax=Strigamia maritima TaxID=126957 RepID=T1J5I2_STRMM